MGHKKVSYCEAIEKLKNNDRDPKAIKKLQKEYKYVSFGEKKLIKQLIDNHITYEYLYQYYEPLERTE